MSSFRSEIRQLHASHRDIVIVFTLGKHPEVMP